MDMVRLIFRRKPPIKVEELYDPVDRQISA
jgi:hypothetical protein